MSSTGGTVTRNLTFINQIPVIIYGPKKRGKKPTKLSPLSNAECVDCILLILFLARSRQFRLFYKDPFHVMVSW